MSESNLLFAITVTIASGILLVIGLTASFVRALEHLVWLDLSDHLTVIYLQQLISEFEETESSDQSTAA